MDTDAFIDRLVTESVHDAPQQLLSIWPFAALALLLEAVLFFPTLGLRADLTDAITSWRFGIKLLIVAALAMIGLALLNRSRRPRPDRAIRHDLYWLAIPSLLLMAAIGTELWLTPADSWAMSLTGKNSVICLVSIVGYGLPAVPLLAEALRRGAPSRPILSGAIAGATAAAIASIFYGVHCTDDSPLFVATWYTLATSILTVAGALWGRLVLRW